MRLSNALGLVPVRDHQSARIPALALSPATTWAAPERQSTRWMWPRRPAIARTSPVGLNAQMSVLPSWSAADVVPHKPRGERWEAPDWRS